MKTRLVSLVIGVLLFASACYGAPKGLDFEDLDPSREDIGLIPRGYKGLSWSKHCRWITKGRIPNSGFEYGTVGRVSLFTSFGYDVYLSGDKFSFCGAYITSTYDDEEQVTVEGWRKGSLVYEHTITTRNDRPYWFDFDFKHIDKLWFRPLGNHIVVDDITFGDDAITVDIDIKPGSDENPINPRSKGRLPVAIMSSDTFNVVDVDLSTVKFGPGGAAPVHSAYEDVDHDGDLDVILHFKTQETGISVGDTEAELTGALLDGTPIIGTNKIRIVPK